jgi:hypothetical protein
MRIIIFILANLFVLYLLKQTFKDVGLTNYLRKKRERAYVRKLCGDNLVKSFIRNLIGTYRNFKYYQKIKKEK